ncbi:hypothetical protein V6N13_061297 [Hibiscus sabdariffa]
MSFERAAELERPVGTTDIRRVFFGMGPLKALVWSFVRDNLVWQLGDGKNVRFWYDNWIDLKLAPPHSREKSLRQLACPREDRSNSFLNRREFGDFALKFDRVNYVEVKMIISWRLKIQEHQKFVKLKERKEYVIEEPVPDEPAANAPRADKDKFKKHLDDMLDVSCLMLATMSPELQKQHEDMNAYNMIQNLKEIYEGQARQERYETSKALFQCKMSEGSLVGAHVIKMMGYIQTLDKLGFALKDELATDVILQSLPDSFKPFVLNFNMNEINKTLPQLLGMLRTVKSDLKKNGSKSILMIRETKGKKKTKSKGNGKSKPKRKDALKPEKGISKEAKWFYSEKSGHWKRNCPLYLEEVKKSKANGASSSGMNAIDVNI